MQEESPEGGRFKKEIQIDSQSYLLLIRDEGGAPEMQVSVLVAMPTAVHPTMITHCVVLSYGKQLIICNLQPLVHSSPLGLMP